MLNWVVWVLLIGSLASAGATFVSTTWIGGESTPDLPAQYVTGGGGYPGNRQMGSMVASSAGFWIFGGMADDGSHNDLWFYSLTTRSWTWVSGSNLTDQLQTATYPSARWQHASVIAYANSTMYTFGGFGNGSMWMNDLWVTNVTNPTQVTWTQIGIGATQFASYTGPGAWPGGRKGHGMAFDGAAKLYVFGGSGFAGSGSAGIMQELWQFHIPTAQWTFLSGSQVAGYSFLNLPTFGTFNVTSALTTPGARQYCTIVVSGNEIWAFAGDGYGSNNGTAQPLGDLWRWHIPTSQWAFMGGYATSGTGSEIGLYPTSAGTSGPGYLPGSRYGHTMTTDVNGDLWAFNGFGLGSVVNQTGMLDDIWKYEVSTGYWIWMDGSMFANNSMAVYSPAGSQYIGSRRYALAGQSVSNNYTLYGGSTVVNNLTYIGILDDLWAINLNPNSCASNPCVDGATCINGIGSYSCVCPVGYAQTSSAVCTACNPGTYGPSIAGNTCIVCQPGTFTNTTIQSQCTLCPVGSFGAFSNATSCRQCPAGRFQSATHGTACPACDVQTFSDSGSGICLPCAVNTTAPNMASPNCTACDVGYMGVACLTPICVPGCQNGGTCTGPNQCQCPPFYIGKQSLY